MSGRKNMRKYRGGIVTIFVTMLLLCLHSCDKAEDPISHRYPCRFFFYREMHPNSILFAAYASPGSYVYVYTKIETTEGAAHRFVYVQSNDGRTALERNRIETQIEANAPYMLGASNEIGLIVGCTNFNGPAAYDRTCPNCAERQPMAWTENRQRVACSSCKRKYELETGAVVEGAEGDALMRYKVGCDDVKLTVGN
jgi:nitrite reductase/ring-hydroxylating ferredoxin subunit